MSPGWVMLLSIGSLCTSMVILSTVTLTMIVKMVGHLAFWQSMTFPLHSFSLWRHSTQLVMDLVSQQLSVLI